MKSIITLFTFLSLSMFQGCSTKIESMKPSYTEINTTKNTDTDEIETDDFADEYEDENKTEIIDPLSGYNEMMTNFNDSLFVYVVNPISNTYAKVFPHMVRLGISNFLHNIQFPIRFTNNLLQAKFKNSLEETERFVLNSTVGIAGLWDPASLYFDIEAHNEDFGQTLGYYGVGAGFHVVLPLLGPSNLRDIVGLVADGYVSPLVYQSALAKYRLPQNYWKSAGIYE